jgi:Fis family transcriptional regulator, factor for inversion stimulation protein
MTSPIPAVLSSSPELNSLYRIALISQSHSGLQDYFHDVSTILSEYFSVTYSALILQEPQKDSLSVEGVFGLGKELYPAGCSSRKGTIGKVLDSRKPMAIHNLGQEPLYEDMVKGTKRVEKIRPPLLCVPLVAENESIGVININSLFGGRDEFNEDFCFLSTLSAILTPAIRSHQLKGESGPAKYGKAKPKPPVLEELLKERLTEVLNSIDPYLESKAKLGLLDDIVALVEKIVIASALEKVEYVQVAAAQLLGINRNTLRKKIKDFKIKCK